jgi:cytoskeletal protein RodZ
MPKDFGVVFVPVSKKRVKKRSKPSGPTPAKNTLTPKKRKFTRQQILIYVFSALVILSLAISFVVGSIQPQPPVPPPVSGPDQSTLTATPEPDDQEATAEAETTSEATQEATAED